MEGSRYSILNFSSYFNHENQNPINTVNVFMSMISITQALRKVLYFTEER